MKADKQKVFEDLSNILQQHISPLEARIQTATRLDAYGTIKASLLKKEFDGMYFGSVIIQKSYVGFYFFPIYTHPHEFKDIPEALRKCLKGKSCFHITTDDPVMMKSVSAMVKKGIQLYKKFKLI
jgi:hypothetical protein